MILFIGLSCVSAQDNQTNDSIMEECLIDDDLVSDVNEGDFSQLNDTIYSSDNFLKLEKDYVYDSEKDENFSSGIVIEKDNFVIDGQGHFIFRKYPITNLHCCLIQFNCHVADKQFLESICQSV